MAKKTSSSRWLARQKRDPYVKQAQEGGWRSRAVFKLEQIDRRDRLLRPGQRIVDLGAAPGGWCQYAARRLNGQGTIVGLDILPIEPLAKVTFLQGDFLESEILGRLSETLAGEPLDLVLSDLAPNFSGIRIADSARSFELAELARDFAVEWLRPDGAFLVKVFEGAELPDFRASLRQSFRQVAVRKPEASRQDSREIYLLARGLQKTDNVN